MPAIGRDCPACPGTINAHHPCGVCAHQYTDLTSPKVVHCKIAVAMRECGVEGTDDATERGASGFIGVDKVGMLFELGVEVVDDFTTCCNNVDVNVRLGYVFNAAEAWRDDEAKVSIGIQWVFTSMSDDRNVRAVIAFIDVSALGLGMSKMEGGPDGPNYARGDSGREGYHWSSSRQEGAHLAQSAILLTKICTPKNDAVGLVNDH